MVALAMVCPRFYWFELYVWLHVHMLFELYEYSIVEISPCMSPCPLYALEGAVYYYIVHIAVAGFALV